NQAKRKAEDARLSATRAGGPVRRLRPNKVWSCVGYSEKLTQCVAAATGPKRREPMASGAGHGKAEAAVSLQKASRLCKTASSKRTVI
ncbi:hypothetical protein, partial [Geobacillus sp. LYN3]|uniref:hypothetical protein n=1 Tax=Geobacillus sp. LYN3 TaxID=2169582 RepID=UPI000DE6F574